MSTNSTDPQVAILRGADELEYKERPAAAEIRPGMLLEYANGEVQPHSSAGTATAPIFSVVNRKRGMLLDDPDGQNDTYAAGENTLYVVGDNGYQFYALLAAGESVTDGAQLVSDGAGGFRALNTANTGEDASHVIAQAVEAVDNSGGTGPVRVRLELL